MDEEQIEQTSSGKEPQPVQSTTAKKEDALKILMPHKPDPIFAAYAHNFDITKLSNTKLNAMVAHRSNIPTKFVKCHFCGKYDKVGTFNCTKCNSSLMNDTIMNNLLNDNEKAANAENAEDELEAVPYWEKINRCCDTCMNNFTYGCIYFTIIAVLLAFPLFEIINIGMHWNNYGGCSVYFQYLILSKLLITMFLYALVGIHIKFKKVKLHRMVIFCTGLFLFFGWLIVATIIFFGDGNFDHSHCNAHDQHTAGYYDFMYIEIMLVYTIFAFIISFYTWRIISNHEKVIKAIVYGQATMMVICLPTAMPICEIILLAVFWNNHGHCSDKFEWYILVKLVFTLGLFSVCGGLFCWFRKFKNVNNEKYDKARSIIINVVITIVYIFMFFWAVMAGGMFFDKDAYDHRKCNHSSVHTAIYYDWMFVEIILTFALLYLGGNVILCLIFAGLLCNTKKDPTQSKE